MYFKINNKKLKKKTAEKKEKRKKEKQPVVDEENVVLKTLHFVIFINRSVIMEIFIDVLHKRRDLWSHAVLFL
jgi:hypothetical protein